MQATPKISEGRAHLVGFNNEFLRCSLFTRLLNHDECFSCLFLSDGELWLQGNELSFHPFDLTLSREQLLKSDLVPRVSAMCVC
jgi:hypothetical protein